MNKVLLQQLMEMPGIPGYEQKISSFFEDEAKELGLETMRDNLGSIFAIKKSGKKDAYKLMIDAHMDEVGFIVMAIDDNGLIRFEEKGGIWKHSLAYQRLRVWDSKLEDSYSGVVTFKREPLPQSAPSPLPDINKLHLDIGAKSKKEVLSWGINIGSTITFDTQVDFNGDRVIGKAVDNRAGLSMVIELMRYIADKEFDFDIYIGASAQEEVGLRGAGTSTHMIDPDLAMIVDISPAYDFPINVGKGALGKGTYIRHKDAMTIYPKKVTTYLEKLFDENKIKYQHYFSMGGTNAGRVHLSREGVTTFPFGFLARNLHIGSTVMDINDYKETLKSMKFFVESLNKNIIKELKG